MFKKLHFQKNILIILNENYVNNKLRLMNILINKKGTKT